MSSIWTPGGEHEVPRERPAGAESGPSPGSPGQATPDSGARGGGGGRGQPTDAELAEQLRAMQDELLSTPAAVVVANHAFGLFELAALHLGAQPPQLPEAQLAIDGLGALVEGLKGRLGDHEPQLAEGLAQLRLAFVQIRAVAQEQGQGAGDAEAGASEAEGSPSPD